MIKYKAKIFCKIHVIIIQRNALHVYIMGDDFLYPYFFYFLFLIFYLPYQGIVRIKGNNACKILF